MVNISYCACMSRPHVNVCVFEWGELLCEWPEREPRTQHFFLSLFYSYHHYRYVLFVGIFIYLNIYAHTHTHTAARLVVFVVAVWRASLCCTCVYACLCTIFPNHLRNGIVRAAVSSKQYSNVFDVVRVLRLTLCIDMRVPLYVIVFLRRWQFNYLFI